MRSPFFPAKILQFHFSVKMLLGCCQHLFLNSIKDLADFLLQLQLFFLSLHCNTHNVASWTTTVFQVSSSSAIQNRDGDDKEKHQHGVLYKCSSTADSKLVISETVQGIADLFSTHLSQLFQLLPKWDQPRQTALHQLTCTADVCHHTPSFAAIHKLSPCVRPSS